jgi:hypothetical protein
MPTYKVTVTVTASSREQARADLLAMSAAHTNKSVTVGTDFRELIG